MLYYLWESTEVNWQSSRWKYMLIFSTLYSYWTFRHKHHTQPLLPLHPSLLFQVLKMLGENSNNIICCLALVFISLGSCKHYMYIGTYVWNAIGQIKEKPWIPPILMQHLLYTILSVHNVHNEFALNMEWCISAAMSSFSMRLIIVFSSLLHFLSGLWESKSVFHKQSISLCTL